MEHLKHFKPEELSELDVSQLTERITDKQLTKILRLVGSAWPTFALGQALALAAGNLENTTSLQGFWSEVNQENSKYAGELETLVQLLAKMPSHKLVSITKSSLFILFQEIFSLADTYKQHFLNGKIEVNNQNIVTFIDTLFTLYYHLTHSKIGYSDEVIFSAVAITFNELVASDTLRRLNTFDLVSFEAAVLILLPKMQTSHNQLLDSSYY